VGRRLTLTDGSVALIQTFGVQSGGLLRLEATEAVDLAGVNPEVTVRSSLRTETLSDSRGADILVETQRLSITDGAWVLVTVFGEGDGGDVSVNAPESTEVSGFASSRPDIFSILSSATFAPGDSGNITLSTGRLTLLDGGSLSSPAFFSTGNSGDVIVNATESIEMAGVTPLVFNPSSIAAASVGFGNGGTLIVNTPRLLVRDGAVLSTSTLADGRAGNVFVNATESIEVTGAASGSDGASLPAQIGSDAFLADPALQAFLGVPSIPSGDAGNTTINTPRLIVSDGAEVTVANEGTGRAGNLIVNADSILLLDSDAGIAASTASGEGGNITLNADTLKLRNESQITTEAGGSGNGGNITLNVETISALENSLINANAFEGSGGNIRLTAEGIFFSPNSAITASSQLGIDGLIDITEPEVDTSSALVQLSSELIDPATQVVSDCQVAVENTFIVTGNGGLPPDPTGVLRGQDIWVDTRLTEIRESHRSNEEANSEESSLEPQPISEVDGNRDTDRSSFLRLQEEALTDPTHAELVEANGWRVDANGNVQLVSYQPRNAPFLPSECLLER